MVLPIESVLCQLSGRVPGLVIAALVADRIGRKLTIAGFLFTAAIATLPLLGVSAFSLHPALQDFSIPSLFIVCLFVARAAIMGSFQTLFMYAPEVSYGFSVKFVVQRSSLGSFD